MKQNLRVSLGVVVLALATLAAVIFALLNFDQRSRYEQVYDGVIWLDTDHGVKAESIEPNSPASHTAIRPGDILLAFNDASITRAADVARRLDRAGLWTIVHYKLSRNGEEFETPLVTAPLLSPWLLKITFALSACFTCSSACSFSSAGGMLPGPCTSTFFAWLLSAFGRSTSAENWTLSTGRFIGPKSWRVCWCPSCCSISLWSFLDGPNRRRAPQRNCWPSISCPWFCCWFM